MWIKALPYIAAAILAASIYTVGHVKGTSSCEIKSAKKEAGMVAKEEQSHAKIEMRVNSLPDSKLNAALSRFMRD